MDGGTHFESDRQRVLRDSEQLTRLRLSVRTRSGHRTNASDMPLPENADVRLAAGATASDDAQLWRVWRASTQVLRATRSGFRADSRQRRDEVCEGSGGSMTAPATPTEPQPLADCSRSASQASLCSLSAFSRSGSQPTFC
jgi:hypothetical protein